MREIIRGALGDLGAAIRLRRVWIALAREDIGDQHRRTALGPFWMLLSYLAFAGTFIFVFIRDAPPDYPAYVATGLLVWFFIMETVTQSVSLFLREQSFINGTALPLSVYVLRLAAQSAIRGAYALAGCVAILIASGTALSLGWLWAAGGLLLVLALTPAAIIVFAFLGAYFPDSDFIIANLMRIGMFLTPVFWLHGGEASSLQAAFYTWNPFTYLLEIVRQPILTGTFPTQPLIVSILIGLALWAAALLLLGTLRRRVVFVL